MYLHDFSEVNVSIMSLFSVYKKKKVHVMQCTQAEKKNIGQSAEDNIIGLNKYCLYMLLAFI